MHVRKGDKVLVITGNDKGKSGKVLKVFRDRNKAVVEGVRIIKRHTRPSQKNQQGGIVEKEAPIDASNLQVICPDCGKASGMSRVRDEDGNLSRKCKACGEIITAG
jgi:large subunit ribosomal protein L24